MGIYVHMRENYRIPTHFRARDRLFLAERILHYFERGAYFKLRSVKIWDRSYSEVLGGKLLDDFSDVTFRANEKEIHEQLINNYYRKYYHSIILFEGTWNFEGKTFEGFISVNNDYSWKRIYYDIEIDCYSKGNIDDIVELFLELDYYKDMVKELNDHISQYTSDGIISITSIFYSLGVPDEEDLENILVMYTSSKKSFIRFLYKRLKKEKDSWIENNVKPYTQKTFLSEIFDNKITERQFQQFSEEVGLIAIPGGSVTFIAENGDSFINFYTRFKEEVFKPIAITLPTASKLRQLIQNAINKARSLDDYR